MAAQFEYAMVTIVVGRLLDAAGKLFAALEDARYPSELRHMGETSRR